MIWLFYPELLIWSILFPMPWYDRLWFCYVNTNLVSPSCLTMHAGLFLFYKWKLGGKGDREIGICREGMGDRFDPYTLYTYMLLNQTFRNKIQIQSSPALPSLVDTLHPFPVQSISQTAPGKKTRTLPLFSWTCKGSSAYSEPKSLQCPS